MSGYSDVYNVGKERVNVGWNNSKNRMSNKVVFKNSVLFTSCICQNQENIHRQHWCLYIFMRNTRCCSILTMIIYDHRKFDELVQG